MSLKRIISETLDGNPVGLKEVVSKILAEKVELAIEAKMNEANEMKGDHLTSAKLVHADLKQIDSLSPESKKILKRHETMLINKYGADWRVKAGIKEDLGEDFDQINEITQTERRNLAFFEKQAVRAAEKANVGALSRAEKEAWIDDYLAKNHIPKGAAGSAVYSGVIKVRPIKESLDESAPFKSEGDYVVKGKSPFWKQDHYINTHEDPRATLIKRHIKHATRMSFEDATRHAKDWEKSGNVNKYKTEVVKINEQKSVTEATLEDKMVAAMLAKRKKQAEAEQQGKKKVSWADISKSFDKKTEK